MHFFNGVPCNHFCFPAPCKCSLIAQRAELCTSMKNYQQALHDADILCRNKPHWPAVWCLLCREVQNENCSFLCLFSVVGSVMLRVFLEEHHGINWAGNVPVKKLTFSRQVWKVLSVSPVGRISVVGSQWCGLSVPVPIDLLGLVLQLGNRIGSIRFWQSRMALQVHWDGVS